VSTVPGGLLSLFDSANKDIIKIQVYKYRQNTTKFIISTTSGLHVSTP